MSEKKNPRLYELLAVEQEKKGNAERARNKTIDNFRSSKIHYTGMKRTFKPFSVDEAQGEIAGERLEGETKLVSTVPEELNKTLETIKDSIDIGLKIDDANTNARADIIVNNVVLGESLPATFLLQLEKKLRELRVMFKEIPTFDPVKIWEKDEVADKKHVLRSEPVVTIRKQKTKKYNVMYEATKEHPAQIDIVEIDEPVGEIKSYEWTGMISPGKKNELITNADALIEAVKAARARANSIDVDPTKKIATELFDYLLNPIKGA